MLTVKIKDAVKDLKEFGGILYTLADDSYKKVESKAKKSIKKILTYFEDPIWCFTKNSIMLGLSPPMHRCTVTMIDVSRINDVEISKAEMSYNIHDHLYLTPPSPDDIILQLKLSSELKYPYSGNIRISKSDPQLYTLTDMLAENGRPDLALKIRSF